MRNQRGYDDGKCAETRLGEVQPTSFPVPEMPEEVREIKRHLALLDAWNSSQTAHQTTRETPESTA